MGFCTAHRGSFQSEHRAKYLLGDNWQPVPLGHQEVEEKSRIWPVHMQKDKQL